MGHFVETPALIAMNGPQNGMLFGLLGVVAIENARRSNPTASQPWADCSARFERSVPNRHPNRVRLLLTFAPWLRIKTASGTISVRGRKFSGICNSCKAKVVTRGLSTAHPCTLQFGERMWIEILAGVARAFWLT